MTTATPAAPQPFWHRIPETLLFPMQKEALIMLIVLTVCRLVVYLPFPIIPTLISIILTMGLFKYAAECLLRAAHGELTAPGYSMEVSESDAWSYLGLQIILLGMLVLAFIFGGVWAGLMTAVLFAFILPASFILLTMTRSVAQALNPAAWFEVVGLIGAPYLVLAVLCFGYFVAGMFAAVYFEMMTAFPFIRVIGGLVSWFIMQYVVIACFHLMGYVVFQYADRLGHEVVSDALPATLPNLRLDPDQPLIDRTQAQSDNGDNAGARAALLDHMTSRGATTLAHEHYRKLVKKDNDRAALIEHGRRFVAVLAAQHNDKRAVEVYAETVSLDNTFRPDIPDEVFRVASRASMMGQHKLAIHLLDGFHQRYNKHPDVVKNLLLAARILLDKLGDAPRAQRVLDLVAAKWPDHALTPERVALQEAVAITQQTTP